MPYARVLYALLGVLTAGIVALAVFQPIKVLPRSTLAPGFALIDASGTPVNNESLRGRLGKQIYAKAACNTCHGAKKGERIVGPSAYGQFEIAATRKPGISAREYLRESIENPNAFVVEGFTPGIMPQTFKQTLKPEEIDAILDHIQRDFSQQ